MRQRKHKQHQKLNKDLTCKHLIRYKFGYTPPIVFQTYFVIFNKNDLVFENADHPMQLKGYKRNNSTTNISFIFINYLKPCKLNLPAE